MTVEQILDRLNGVKPSGSGFVARCPAHNDQKPSLSVGTGQDGRVLLTCFAGCDAVAITAAMGLTVADLFVQRAPGCRSTVLAEYHYHDETGALLYVVERRPGKQFPVRRPDGAGGWLWNLNGTRRVVYRLPELVGRRNVFIPEGEKDVNRLWTLDLPATCNPGGASRSSTQPKWTTEFSQQLVSAGVKRVVVLPDRDEPGRVHAAHVARTCHAAGLQVRVVELPDLDEKGDVTDWLDLGHSVTDLLALVKMTPLYERSPIGHAPLASYDNVSVASPRTLDETIAIFRRWLYLDDPSAVCALAAALVANRAPGDPVWLLLVCAPSTGKTEILSAAMGLSWVTAAAKVTEASLLSGTAKRERSAGATGGLLRQIGEFGVLLCKDFTSILAQNNDTRAEAMAALREVYDGRWDRPVGTDGGRVLSWTGKCGLIGGVTPALDQYGQVLSSLGDRFLLLRLPDAPVEDVGAAALRHGDQEFQMRRELRDALTGLVDHADLRRVNRPLVPGEQRRLIRLAAYTARARTAVVRDGFRQDVVFLPQVEGPGRLVKAYARLLGGLEAIGCVEEVAWATLTRIAIDCAPALRTKVIRELVARQRPVRTSEIAAAIETVTKTASRHLEDLSIICLADHTKQSAASNAPDLWQASDWLRDFWPESRTEKYDLTDKTRLVEDEDKDGSTGTACSRTFQSHFAEAGDLPSCLRELVAPDHSDPRGREPDE
jgi:hypothetical protein